MFLKQMLELFTVVSDTKRILQLWKVTYYCNNHFIFYHHDDLVNKRNITFTLHNKLNGLHAEWCCCESWAKPSCVSSPLCVGSPAESMQLPHWNEWGAFSHWTWPTGQVYLTFLIPDPRPRCCVEFNLFIHCWALYFFRISLHRKFSFPQSYLNIIETFTSLNLHHNAHYSI